LKSAEKKRIAAKRRKKRKSGERAFRLVAPYRSERSLEQGASRDSGCHQINFGGHPQRAEHLATVFPSKTERTHVSETEAPDDIRQQVLLAHGKIAVPHHILRPSDKFGQLDVTVQVMAQLAGDGVSGYRHT
jgi:hypothetical protein